MSNHKFIVGVMGTGDHCLPHVAEAAYQLGQLLAGEGWVVLSGGRDVGVMDAVSKGAKAAGGLTIGVLPLASSSISSAVDVPIITDTNMGRNNINVISCDAVVSCGIGVGTASEIALRLCAEKPIIMLHAGDDAWHFFHGLRPHLTHRVNTPEEAVAKIKALRIQD